jgi:hypothetical protein|tara:strand:- start:579 stop:779 length:201 start_codon:yes stop_codon:yes gene_type:complete
MDIMKEFAKLTTERLKYIITGAVSKCEKSKEEYAKKMAIKYAKYSVACEKVNIETMSYDEFIKSSL